MFVCLSVWYVILEHEDKNVSAELIWRVLIPAIKKPIHIYQSKFSFNVQRSLKHIIIGKRAKRARHSQVCSIENRGYIYIYCTCKFCSYNP